MPSPGEQFADLKFPLCGVDLSRAYGQQLPRPLADGSYGGTTPVGQNVRAYEPGTQRARGGQRPGLLKYILSQVSGPSLIQELNLVVGVGYTPPGPGGTAGGGGSDSPGFNNLSIVQMPVQPPSTTVIAPVITYPTVVTSGNTTIFMSSGLGGFPAVVDSGGNIYTRDTNQSVGHSASSIWHSSNVVGGFQNLTATFANATANGMIGFEVGGLANSPVDQATGGSGTNPNPTVQSMTLTPSQYPALVFVVIGADNAVPVVSTPGWSLFASPNPAFLFGYQLVQSGSALIRFTFQTQATYWSGCMVDYIG
jgi:hypothetical protein